MDLYLSAVEGSDSDSLLPWIAILPLLSGKTCEIEEKIDWSEETLIPPPLLSLNYQPLSVISEKHEGKKEENQKPCLGFHFSLSLNLTKNMLSLSGLRRGVEINKRWGTK